VFTFESIEERCECCSKDEKLDRSETEKGKGVETSDWELIGLDL